MYISASQGLNVKYPPQALGHQKMASFGEVVEPLQGEVLLKEVTLGRWVSSFYIQGPLSVSNSRQGCSMTSPLTLLLL